jgi:hypothetical protein
VTISSLMLVQKQNTSLLLMKVRIKVCIFPSIVKNMHKLYHAHAFLKNGTLCLYHLLSVGMNGNQISPQFLVSLVVLPGDIYDGCCFEEHPKTFCRVFCKVILLFLTFLLIALYASRPCIQVIEHVRVYPCTREIYC